MYVGENVGMPQKTLDPRTWGERLTKLQLPLSRLQSIWQTALHHASIAEQ